MNTYLFHAYIGTMLNYGEDAKKSLLGRKCFYKDEKFGTVDPTTSDNPELKKTYELTKKSKTLDLIGLLYYDIFQQHRLLLSMVDLQIKMIRSKPTFCLMAVKTKDAAKPYFRTRIPFHS